MSLLDKFKKKTKKEEKEKPLETVDKPKPKASQKQLVQVYQIIKQPQITEKSTFLGEANKYVFKVFPFANKTEIKKAIEALYNVKVVKVNLIHLPGKQRRLGRYQGWRQGLKKGFKKAIVTLAKGEKIELASK